MTNQNNWEEEFWNKYAASYAKNDNADGFWLSLPKQVFDFILKIEADAERRGRKEVVDKVAKWAEGYVEEMGRKNKDFTNKQEFNKAISALIEFKPLIALLRSFNNPTK